MADLKFKKSEETYDRFGDAVDKFTGFSSCLFSSDSYEDLRYIAEEFPQYEELKEETEASANDKMIVERLKGKVKRYKVKKNEMKEELEKSRKEIADKNKELKDIIQALEEITVLLFQLQRLKKGKREEKSKPMSIANWIKENPQLSSSISHEVFPGIFIYRVCS